MPTKQIGFTLELMIVVAIVGILAGVGYPSYSAYIIDNNRNDVKVGTPKALCLERASRKQGNMCYYRYFNVR